MELFLLELWREDCLAAVRAFVPSTDEQKLIVDTDGVPGAVEAFMETISELIDWSTHRLKYRDSEDEEVFIEDVDGGMMESVLDALDHWPFMYKVQYSIVPRPASRSIRAAIVDEFPDVSFSEAEPLLPISALADQMISRLNFNAEKKKEFDDDEIPDLVLSDEPSGMRCRTFAHCSSSREDPIANLFSSSSSSRKDIMKASRDTSACRVPTMNASFHDFLLNLEKRQDEIQQTLRRDTIKCSHSSVAQCFSVSSCSAACSAPAISLPLPSLSACAFPSGAMESIAHDATGKRAVPGTPLEEHQENEISELAERVERQLSLLRVEDHSMAVTTQTEDEVDKLEAATVAAAEKRDSRLAKYKAPKTIDAKKQKKASMDPKVVLLKQGKASQMMSAGMGEEEAGYYTQSVRVMNLSQSPVQAKIVVARSSPGARPVLHRDYVYLQPYVPTKVSVGLIDDPTEETSYVTYTLNLFNSPISPPITIFSPASSTLVPAYRIHRDPQEDTVVCQEQQRAISPAEAPISLIPLPPTVIPARALEAPPLSAATVIPALEAPPRVEALPAPPPPPPAALFHAETLKGMISRKNSTEEEEEEQEAEAESDPEVETVIDALVQGAIQSAQKEEETRAPMLIIEETAEEVIEREEGCEEIEEAEEVKVDEEVVVSDDDEEKEEGEEEVDETASESDSDSDSESDDDDDESLCDVEELRMEDEDEEEEDKEEDNEESDTDSDFEVIQNHED